MFGGPTEKCEAQWGQVVMGLRGDFSSEGLKGCEQDRLRGSAFRGQGSTREDGYAFWKLLVWSVHILAGQQKY